MIMRQRVIKIDDALQAERPLTCDAAEGNELLYHGIDRQA